MPLIPIDKVRRTMLRALEVRRLTSEYAALLADDFLDAELENKSTHGLGKFLLMDELLANRGGPPRATIDSDAFALVDGRKELGQIAALLIVFPLLLMIRGESFKKISALLNWGLIILGILLLIYQLNGYFSFEDHHDNEIHENKIELEDPNHHKETHPHSHDHDDSNHSHDEHHHTHD